MTTRSETRRGPAAALLGFAQDRRGVGVLMLVLFLPVLFGFLTLGADVAGAYTFRNQMQTAADATVLAVAKRSALDDTLDGDALRAYGAAYLAVQMGNASYTVERFSVDTANVVVGLDLTGSVPASFARLFGKERIAFAVASEARYPRLYLEVALALDNTPSIDATELAGIKSAAKGLIDETAAGLNDRGSDFLRVALVPFAGGVRHDPANWNDGWLDWDGASSTHFNHVGTVTYSTSGGTATWRPTRRQLFAQITNESWAGCVENRPYPLDVNDVSPSNAQSDSLYVPYFAFDEYDVSGSQMFNDYLDDRGGVCTGGRPSNAIDSIDHTCKYGSPSIKVASDRSSIYTVSGGVVLQPKRGPNLYCTSLPLVPLTADLATVKSRVDAMYTGNWAGTDLMSGFVWAWRALSPGPPYIEGRAYGRDDVRKIVVFMSDGDNNGLPGILPHTYGVGASYGMWGYAGDKRLSTSLNDTSSQTAINQVMDVRTREACTNMKAAGVTVYTVNFGGGSDGRAVLQDCASSAKHFFDASSIEELKSAFETIGRELSSLRLRLTQ
ncbi:MAG: pilus assembly protein [Geminicoccaceae bacterium]|nr:pilus assembly protein [Geminicoccaceae bacterium]